MKNIYATKNNKGFTLIELLAVIVILAIILLITVPEVLKTLDQSKSSALQSSADLVSDALTKQILIDQTVGSADRTISPPLETGKKRCLNPTELAAMDITDSAEYVTSGADCVWVCRHTTGKVVVKITAAVGGKFYNSDNQNNVKYSPNNLSTYIDNECTVASQ